MDIVYESLEASGLSVESLTGSRTGLYAGLMCTDYVEHLDSDMNSLPTYRERAKYSYLSNWHGPSLTIDTAYSSSLLAVHQAALTTTER